jgi:chromate transporter
VTKPIGQQGAPASGTATAPAYGGAAAAAHGVTWREALAVWARIGLQSFGGPAGQIALMHRVLVEEKRWISERRFLHALNYCMLLPGPEAMQLATYVGWLMHRTLGGVMAGTLFVLPGFVSILALSVAFTSFQGAPAMQGVLLGLKAAVVAIVAEAVVRIGRRVLRTWAMRTVAAAAFVAIFAYAVPFPFIVLGAAVLGFAGDRLWPKAFEVLPVGSNGTDDESRLAVAVHTRPSVGHAARTLLIWGGLWLAPVLGLTLWLGPNHVFSQMAWLFSKVAVFTFGGAYAVLAYIAQVAVEVRGWLQPGEMLAGLGMAETTPGPLIQVVQFVGYMGAYRDPGALHPVAAGVVASVIVTWVTFVPCFLWIFLGAPYVEALRGQRALSAALSTITAAVVGVVLNLAVWLSIETLFAERKAVEVLGASFDWPRVSSFNGPAMAIAALSAVLLLWLRWGVVRTLAVAVGLGLAWVWWRGVGVA